VVVRKGSRGEIEGTSRRPVEITSKTSSTGWSRGARVSKTKRGKELSRGDTPVGNAQLIKNEVATGGHVEPWGVGSTWSDTPTCDVQRNCRAMAGWCW
jgi:hypothetical protein